MSMFVSGSITSTGSFAELQIRGATQEKITLFGNQQQFINFGDVADSDTGRIQYDHNNNQFQFYANATNILRVLGSGYVLPASNEGVSLGSTSLKWKELVVNHVTASGHISGSSTSTGSFGKILGDITIPSGKALTTSLIKGGSDVEVDTEGAHLKLTASDLRIANGQQIEWNNANTRILGSHASNYIKFDVGGVSNVLYLTNGDVGIGTTAPDGTLHIFESSAGSVTAGGEADNLVIEADATPGMSILFPNNSKGNISFGCPADNDQFTIVADTNNGRFSFTAAHASHTMNFNVGGTQNLKLSGGSGVEKAQFTGNVGIGMAPTHNFNLRSAGNVEFRIQSTDDDARLQISSDTDEGQDSILEFLSNTSTRGSILYDHNTTAASQKMDFKVGDNAVTAMTILGNGNVGIGTTSPESILHIADGSSGAIGAKLIIDNNVSDADGNGTEISFFNAAGASAAGVANSRIRSVASGNTNGYSQLQFWTYHASEAQRMVITSDGNVGIGDSSPSAKLQIKGGGITVSGSNDTSAIQAMLIKTSAASSQGLIGVEGSGTGFIGSSIARAMIVSSTATGTALQLGSAGSVRMTIASNGKVGIGQTSPSSTLHVKSTSADGYIIAESSHAASSGILEARSVVDRDSYVMFREGTSVKAQIFNDASANALVLTDGDNTNTAWLYGGRVGIGTYAPTQKFHVHGGHILITGGPSDGAANGEIRFTYISESSYGVAAKIAGLRTDADQAKGGALAFYTQADNTSDGGTERMRIDASGNVGINRTSPGYKFEVGGVILGTGGVYSHALILAGNSTDGAPSFAMANDPDTGWRSDLSNNMRFITGGTARMVLDSSGNVGIGVTSPATKLDVNGSILAGRSRNIGSYASDDFDLMVANGSNDATAIALFNNAGAFHTGLIEYYNNKLSLGLNNSNSDDALLATSAITITNTGVGIGLTDPNSLFMVGSATGGDVSIARTDTTISDGDSLGSILFKGKDDGGSTIYGIGARIQALCTEDWNEATSEGTSLNFYTTDNGTATHDLRMTINHNGNVTIQDNLTVGGSITAQEFITELNTTTIIETSGSTKFGNTLDDTHEMTGSVSVTGSLKVNGTTISGGGGGSSLWSTNGDKIYYNTDNVGINDTTPTAQLDITTSASGKYGLQVNNNSGNQIFAVYNSGGQDAIVNIGNDGGATKIQLLADGNSYFNGGNVGIGQTSPVGKLDIVGDQAIHLSNTTSNDTNKNTVITHAQYASDTETEGFMLMQGFSNAAINRVDIGGGNSQHNATEQIRFFTAANATTATGTQCMHIDNSGNVGIGVTSPAEKLDVRGTVTASMFHANMSTDAGSPEYSFGGDPDTGMYSAGANVLGFSTGGTVRLNLTSAVLTSQVTGGVRLGIGNGSAAAPTFTFNDDADTGMFRAAANTIAFGVGGSEGARIDSSLRVGLNGITPGNYYANYDDLVIGGNQASGMTIRSSNSTSGVVAFADGTSGQAQYEGEIGYNHNSNFLFFNTAGSYRFVIDADGDVGIGGNFAFSTSHLSTQQYVTIGQEGQYIFANTTATHDIAISTNIYQDTSGNYEYKTTNVGTVYKQRYGQHFFHTFASGTAGNDATPNNALYIGNGGQIGMGTSTPTNYDASADNLVIYQASGHAGITIVTDTSSYGILSFGDGTGASSYRGLISYLHSADSMQFQTGGAERMKIDSSGRVGIGTATPGNYHADADNLVLYGSGNSGMTIASGASSHGNIWFADGTGGVAEYQSRIQFNHNGNTLMFAIGDTEIMRFLSSGNVGIGTTSPGAKLEVNNGNFHVSGSNQRIIVRNDSGVDSFEVGHSTNGAFQSFMQFKDDGGTVMTRFGSGGTPNFFLTGSVGIGTSSPTTFSGFTTVHHKNPSGDTIMLGESDGGVISQIISSDSNSAVFFGARSNHALTFTTNDTRRITVDTSGNVGIGKTSGLGSKLDILGSTNAARINVNDGTGGLTMGHWDGNYVRIESSGRALGIFSYGGNLVLGMSGTPSLTINSSHNITTVGNIYVADSKKILFGAGNDMQIHHAAGDSKNYIQSPSIGFQIETPDFRVTNGNGTERMIQADDDGEVSLWYNGSKKIGTTNSGVTVTGKLTATSKSFLIDHPTKENKKLQYASLEGPENGVYVRGKLEGDVIELPDYWVGLVHEDSITVNLTPIGKYQHLYVEDIKDNKVFVNCVGGDVKCFYTIYGERKDIEKLEVEF